MIFKKWFQVPATVAELSAIDRLFISGGLEECLDVSVLSPNDALFCQLERESLESQFATLDQLGSSNTPLPATLAVAANTFPSSTSTSQDSLSSATTLVPTTMPVFSPVTQRPMAPTATFEPVYTLVSSVTVASPKIPAPITIVAPTTTPASPNTLIMTAAPYVQSLAGAFTSAFILCIMYYCVRPFIKILYRKYPALDRVLPRTRVDGAVDAVIRRSVSNLNIPVSPTSSPNDTVIEMANLPVPVPAPRQASSGENVNVLINSNYGFRSQRLMN